MGNHAFWVVDYTSLADVAHPTWFRLKVNYDRDLKAELEKSGRLDKGEESHCGCAAVCNCPPGRAALYAKEFDGIQPPRSGVVEADFAVVQRACGLNQFYGALKDDGSLVMADAWALLAFAERIEGLFKHLGQFNGLIAAGTVLPNEHTFLFLYQFDKEKLTFCSGYRSKDEPIGGGVLNRGGLYLVERPSRC